jgi:glycosyltransferase involved in cell wall biosynthesis
MKFFIPEDLNSVKSGKHKFLKQLKNRMVDMGMVFTPSNPDIVLHLGRNYDKYFKKCKTVCRLDNLEFNTRKPYRKQNKKVKKAISNSSAVVFQNEYASDAHFNFLDLDKNILHACILNGAEVSKPSTDIEPRYVIANCKWRPHKRLKDIVYSFLMAKDKGFPLDLIVTGSVDKKIKSKHIKYTGWISGKVLKKLIAKSAFGIHLCWLDCCPNSVVEYICSHKPVIYSSSGGIKYVVKENGVSIKDKDWNFKALDLYNPPKINRQKVADAMFYLLNNKIDVKNDHVDIKNIAVQYSSFFEKVLSS